jgi:2-phosphoglycerate kinase
MTGQFVVQLMKQYGCIVPFLVYISNKEKHKERFAARSKRVSLDPRANVYIENFRSIRVIQKSLEKEADDYLLPKIDNTNVDRSISAIHGTILRCLRHVSPWIL